jgi:hypothetical protein
MEEVQPRDLENNEMLIEKKNEGPIKKKLIKKKKLIIIDYAN